MTIIPIMNIYNTIAVDRLHQKFLFVMLAHHVIQNEFEVVFNDIRPIFCVMTILHYGY